MPLSTPYGKGCYEQIELFKPMKYQYGRDSSDQCFNLYFLILYLVINKIFIRYDRPFESGKYKQFLTKPHHTDHISVKEKFVNAKVLFQLYQF